MTQVIIHKTIGKLDQQESMVGSDAKNALPISTSYDWTDLAGLSWIFIDDSMDDVLSKLGGT